MESIQDLEIQALSKCSETIEKLSGESRERVLKYLISRFGSSLANAQSIVPEESLIGKPALALGKAQVKKGKLLKRTPNSYTMLSLNLYPSNSESLKAFYEKHNATNFFEKNLIYAYYLEKILGLELVTIDHIYTCYKQTNQKVPGNLYQSLIDTRNRKGWLDTRDMDNLKVNVTGENYIEHEMPKV